jgi:hypothetical protein
MKPIQTLTQSLVVDKFNVVVLPGNALQPVANRVPVV